VEANFNLIGKVMMNLIGEVLMKFSGDCETQTKTIHQLTIGISSCFLSDRIERISILKEWEPDCKNRNVKISLLILSVQQGELIAGIISKHQAYLPFY
jgi:hypothetical protein